MIPRRRLSPHHPISYSVCHPIAHSQGRCRCLGRASPDRRPTHQLISAAHSYRNAVVAGLAICQLAGRRPAPRRSQPRLQGAREPPTSLRRGVALCTRGRARSSRWWLAKERTIEMTGKALPPRQARGGGRRREVPPDDAQGGQGRTARQSCRGGCCSRGKWRKPLASPVRSQQASGPTANVRGPATA